MTDQTIKPGSYRGLPFYPKKIQTKAGRKIVFNELAHNDNAYIEDLGKKTEKFTLEGTIFGTDPFLPFEDLQNQINAWQEAVEKEGAGIIEVPFKQDRLLVYCDDFSISTLNESLNKAEFSMSLIVKPQSTPFVSKTEQKLTILQKARNFLNNAKIDVTRTVLEILTAKYAVLNIANAGNQNIATIMQIFDTVSFLIEDEKNIISLAISELSQSDLLGQIEILNEITEKADPNTILTALSEAIEFVTEDLITSSDYSASKNQNITNVNAFNHIFKQNLLSNLASSVILSEGLTQERAVFYKAFLSDILNEELPWLYEDSGDYLLDVVTEASNFLTANIANFAPVVTIESDIPNELSAYYWSYRLNGNLDLVDDIILRNNMLDPDFVPVNFEVKNE